MIHARTDYQRIQDPTGKIPQDEPVFLLRGQDSLAPEMLEIYALAAHKAGASPALVDSVYKHAQAMRKWQTEHTVKVPDMPEGVGRY